MQGYVALIAAGLAVALLTFQIVIKKRKTPTPLEHLRTGSCLLQTYKLLAGKADDLSVQRGLKSLSERIASLVNLQHESNPSLSGTFSLTLHLERDGKVRTVMTMPPNPKNDSDPSLVKQLVANLMQRRELFPSLGDDCLIEVEFAILPIEQKSDA